MIALWLRLRADRVDFKPDYVHLSHDQLDIVVNPGELQVVHNTNPAKNSINSHYIQPLDKLMVYPGGIRIRLCDTMHG